MLVSLLLAAPWLVLGRPAAAADLLNVRLDGLEIPIRLDQLAIWSREPRRSRFLASRGFGAAGADVAVWLELLEPDSRADLLRLLRAPLLRDRSFGRQLLDSWAGGQMLAELGDLLTTPEGQPTTALLQQTLQDLLRQQREVTALSLLQALPLPSLSLQLDGLLTMAQQWRRQIDRQRQALRQLEQLALPRRQIQPLAFQERTPPAPQHLSLSVPHRQEPLPLELWPAPRTVESGSAANATAEAAAEATAEAARQPWLLVLPGLGSNADQFGWLASALAWRGWSVVVLQHPGSDGQALKSALDGQRPPPGAETLAVRLRDVAAVLDAQRQGRLPVRGQGVVLVGHSLGAMTALLASGVEPSAGLDARCRRAIDRLPISNPSRLLQCQLTSTGLPAALPRPADLRGLMLFNGFGSLLWPDGALQTLPVPTLMVGGSLDLVTPPLEEQLQLFLPAAQSRSRLVLVDGGSHFSPVRMAEREEVVFRLGRELVGADPVLVQGLLLGLSTDFLLTLQQPLLLPSQVRQQQGVTAYVLDQAAARQWRDGLMP
ncbi:MAG: alpha/beta fold hydrolase [Cyanobacteria bacterium]|nr:alpha/beta fold hydrolase [Cyanobacteriota bacterium]